MPLDMQNFTEEMNKTDMDIDNDNAGSNNQKIVPSKFFQSKIIF